MALPIWALFYKKVVADGSIGISESDTFLAPSGVSVNMDCQDMEELSESKSDNEAEYYFD